jgi:hypothetical protein
MTAPDHGGESDRTRRAEQGPISFSEAEKLMAQWEARHAVAAAGRRVSGLGVPEYLAYARSSEAQKMADRQKHRADAERAARRRRPEPDPHAHLSDLWSWLIPGPPSDLPPDRPGGRRR